MKTDFSHTMMLCAFAPSWLNPDSEVESRDAKGAWPSGRFNVYPARDSRTPKTVRAVKRRERRAPAAWLRFSAFFTSEFGLNWGGK
jgi:hypothetical protein